MWRAYLSMRRSLDLALDQQLAVFGLSSADYALLVPLSESPEGVLRARDLASAVGWGRSRLSHQLRRMEQRGFISRFGCPTDARGTMVALSEAGRRMVAAAAPGHVAAVRSYFVDALSGAQCAQMTALCEQVSAVIDGAGPGNGRQGGTASLRPADPDA